MKTIKIQLPTMQSAHCQMRVNNAVSKIKGADIINIQSGSAEIELENDAIQNDVLKSIEEAGYSISGIDSSSSSIKEKLTFKTNINCSGCVSKVTPFLNSVEGIEKWEVDTNNKEKKLTVVLNGSSEIAIKRAVESAGFKIETINS